MNGLIAAIAIIAAVGVALWWSSRLSRKLGEADQQLENAKESNRRLRDAAEADDRVRRDIAAAGVYAPDENQRD